MSLNIVSEKALINNLTQKITSLNNSNNKNEYNNNIIELYQYVVNNIKAIKHFDRNKLFINKAKQLSENIITNNLDNDVITICQMYLNMISHIH